MPPEFRHFSCSLLLISIVFYLPFSYLAGICGLYCSTAILFARYFAFLLHWTKRFVIVSKWKWVAATWLLSEPFDASVNRLKTNSSILVHWFHLFGFRSCFSKRALDLLPHRQLTWTQWSSTGFNTLFFWSMFSLLFLWSIFITKRRREPRVKF